MRLALTALIALHGAIHVLGFLKWSGLTEIPQLGGWTLFPLTGPWRSLFAVLWLAAMLLFIAAASLRVGSSDAWWIPALIAVLLSQLLVIFAWKDAKAGTVANLVLLLPLLVAAAQASFVSASDAEIRALFRTSVSSPGTRVTREDLSPLPAPVGRWLERAGVVGREKTRAVRLKQLGELRTAPDAAWMPAEAEQYFVVDEPAFVWRVRARMWGILPVAGRDKYAAGSGHMLIKAASLLNLVDSGDEKIAHGAMLRFLGEIVWFPSAALSPYVQWEGIDTTSSRATMRHAGITASAVFHFDGAGRVRGLSSERYLGGGIESKLTPWLVSCTEWRRSHGVEVPVRGDVRWNLAGREFSYYRWEIVDIDYDRPELYDRGAAARRSHEGATQAAPTTPGATQ